MGRLWNACALNSKSKFASRNPISSADTVMATLASASRALASPRRRRHERPTELARAEYVGRLTCTTSTYDAGNFPSRHGSAVEPRDLGERHRAARRGDGDQ